MNPAQGRAIEKARAREISSVDSGLSQQSEGAHWVTINGQHVLIQNSRGAETPNLEDSQENQRRRAEIAGVARKHNGDRSMPYKPGRPTCNLFVQKAISQSGAPKPLLIKADGSKGAPSAAEWAGSAIPGWRFLKPGEMPQPGDVAARKETFSDATGHSGIVTAVSKSGVVTVIAAHEREIGPDTSFAHRHTEGYNNVYRRYVGE